METKLDADDGQYTNTYTTTEIESVGAWAITEITKVDEEADASKKAVIQEAARRLEAKIPNDRIALELVKQLSGVVSERYIRNCLDEKYKQRHRIDNGKKQKSKSKLAAQQPLNMLHIQEIEQPTGLVLLQRTHDGSQATEESARDFLQNAKLPDNLNPDKIATVVTLRRDSNKSDKGNIEVYRFSIPWEAVHAYMQSLFAKNGKNEKVSFYVVVDKQKRELISANFGELSEYPLTQSTAGAKNNLSEGSKE